MLEERQILNLATVPHLQAMFIEQMKSSRFSVATDRSDNQGLEKMNPVTVRFLKCPSNSSTVISIFDAIDMSNGQKRYYMG